ncbi:MAG: DUF1573 domain-containing protein [Gemmatimonadales bacterium]|nr:DUF1573 domain-containing protein [Gemmatimonadales bacterium]
MPRTIAKTTLTLAILVLLHTAAGAQVISVTPTTIDLGVMEQMQEKETMVTVTNNGGGRLIIKDVKTDCGCTVPTLTKKELGPGESTVIDIKFNSKKFHGKIIKMVNIFSNDRQHPAVDVLIIAEVKTALVIDPASQKVGFTRGIGGEDRTNKVTFTATDDVDLEISCDHTRKGDFDLKVINNVEGNPQVSILEVTLPGNSEPGKKRDGARVRTNIPGFETVDLDMRAWVVAALGYSPSEVKFRYTKDLKKNIRFAPEKQGLVFKITKAEINLPEIQVVVDETIVNKETYVRLTGTPLEKSDPRAIATRGQIKGTLTVYTDLADIPKLEIPVSYMIRM